MGFPKGFVDHKNGNSLDNRKENLRLCTIQQNSFNRKPKNGKLKVFYLNKSSNKYSAQIGFNNKKIYLGQFKSKEEAAKAYNEAAIKYFGEFACLNKIGENHDSSVPN
jgi:hypothetical protein